MHKLTVLVLWAFMCFSSMAYAASFTPLGYFPTGDINSSAQAVSADGQVVIGHSSTNFGAAPFRWTAADGMVYLGSLPGGGNHGIAYDVSSDGSTIVGVSSGSDGHLSFRWTESGGMESLGYLSGGRNSSSAQAISPDGSVIVGRGSPASGFQAYRWESDQMVGLQSANLTQTAMGVSNAGEVVVGNNGISGQAFRWTAETGAVNIGSLSNGSLSAANAITADGSTIVGWSSNENSPNTSSYAEAFMWTEADGMQGLGYLDGWRSIAADITDDGSIIVGSASDDGDNIGFIWTEEYGMLNFNDLLAAQGVDMGGYQVQRISGISADGNYVVGTALRPDGNYEAFIATTVVPIPPAMLLFGSGLAALGFARRKLA